jgi:6-phosphogluconolactonase (cycloisomerase 2 family)
MKFFDLFRRFSRRTITGASLPLAAGFLLWAAPLRAEFAYLLNGQSGIETITTYTIGSNGALSQVGSPLKPTSPYYPLFETMDPNGRFVFFLDLSTNGTSNDVLVYSIGSNGALTQVPGSPFALGVVGQSLSVDPTGKFLYAISPAAQSTIVAYSIGVNGTLTAAKGSPFTIPGLYTRQTTIDPTGKFLYAAGMGGSSGGGIAAYSIGSNGALTIVPGSPFAASTGVQGAFDVTIDPTGHDLFTLDVTNSRILAYTIGSNGALTPVAGSPFATQPQPASLALDPTGQFLYVGNLSSNNNTVSVYSNSAGTLTPISGSPFSIPVPSDEIWSVTLDPTGRFAYVEDFYDSTLFTFSIGSGGGLTLVTSSAIQATWFSFIPLLAPFVYAHNENTGNSSVSPFTTDSNGALLPVPGSPFPSGQALSGPVDPTAKFVYVPNYNDNSLSLYSIGPNGSLTALSTVATGNAPVSVAPDPTGRYLYVTNSGDNTVSAYTIGLTGTLTPVTGSPFAGGSAPGAITVDRSGNFVYVTNENANTVLAYKIGSNGALTPVTGSPFATGGLPNSVTVDPVGNFAYVANIGDNTVSAYSIGSNGALTPVSGSPFAAGQSPSSVTVDPTGLFVYVTNELGNSVSAYSILANGALTPVTGSSFAAGAEPYSVAVDPTGTYAYVTNAEDNTMSAYVIGSNGSLTPLSGSPFTGLNLPNSVAVSPIPFATSTSSFETEAGTPPTFTLSDTFTLGRNSTGINPVSQQVILRIDTFAVTIPPNNFNRQTNGTFTFDGIINQVTYKVTIAPLGSNSFKLSAKATGQDLSTLGKNVSIVLMVGGNTGTSTASHKQ